MSDSSSSRILPFALPCNGAAFIFRLPKLVGENRYSHDGIEPFPTVCLFRDGCTVL